MITNDESPESIVEKSKLIYSLHNVNVIHLFNAITSFMCIVISKFAHKSVNEDIEFINDYLLANAINYYV